MGTGEYLTAPTIDEVAHVERAGVYRTQQDVQSIFPALVHVAQPLKSKNVADEHSVISLLLLLFLCDMLTTTTMMKMNNIKMMFHYAWCSCYCYWTPTPTGIINIQSIENQN